MSIEVFDCEQGTPEWYACRLGIPTASEFDTVMAKGRGGGESKTRRTYLLKLIGEKLTGQPMENYSNAHMERGKVMEQEARDLYAMLTDTVPTKVGFLRNGRKGCSPDSLIGDKGLLEIKTKLPHLQLDALLGGYLPAEHVAQCQGQLWIAEREWLDFFSYWPGLEPLMVRVTRNDKYIDELAKAVQAFNDEMDETIEYLNSKYHRKAA